MNILQVDGPKNTVMSHQTATATVLVQRMGMWGAEMFGDNDILGAVYTSTYITGEGKNILSLDAGIHVTEG